MNYTEQEFAEWVKTIREYVSALEEQPINKMRLSEIDLLTGLRQALREYDQSKAKYD